MVLEIVASACVLTGVVWCARAAWSMRAQRAFARQRDQAIQNNDPELAPRADAQELAGRFGRETLITADGFLSRTSLQRLRQD